MTVARSVTRLQDLTDREGVCVVPTTKDRREYFKAYDSRRRRHSSPEEREKRNARQRERYAATKKHPRQTAHREVPRKQPRPTGFGEVLEHELTKALVGDVAVAKLQCLRLSILWRDVDKGSFQTIKYSMLSGRKYSTQDGLSVDPGPLAYDSWDNFLAEARYNDVARWLRRKIRGANKWRDMSGSPDELVSFETVLVALLATRGRCTYCGSLAIEPMPTAGSRLAPFAHKGRRVGTLDHAVSRFSGGPNALGNLVWCCLWCNDWKAERRWRADDHGGYYPDDVADSFFQLADHGSDAGMR